MAENVWLSRGCAQYLCPKFPRCRLAAGACCDITDLEDRALIAPEECFLREDKPLFAEKPGFWRPQT